MTQSSGTLEKAKFSHIVITFIASIIITAQSSINSELNTYTENPLITALINFTTGLIVLSVMMIFSSPIRQGFISIPRLVREGRLKRWQLFGGLSGAFFVASQSSLVQVIGVAIFTVAAVAGQTSAALLVDKAGIGPAGKQPVTLMRIGAAILGIVGVLVSVLGQDSTGQFAFGAVLISFAAGALVSTQPALNGQIANHTGQPAAATMVNFIVGFITLVVVYAVAHQVNPQSFNVPPMPWENPVIWLGGPFGVLFVLTASFMAKTLGVFLFTLTSVVGQLSGAILMDVLFPTASTNITWQLLLGISITGAAVVLASGKKKTKTQ
ncbi:MAG: DMT family transporter [Actinobacteria bacterium]|nr:DMT family transporter [Actinomycetota bacterium]